MNKKVLFVTYGGGHANIARIVYQYLHDHSEYQPEVLALTVAGKIMDKYGVPYKTLRDHLPLFPDAERIVSYGEALAETAYDPASGMSREESVVYLGCGFRDMVDEFGEDEAWKRFRESGRKAFCPTAVMKTILEKEAPALVVVTCDVRTELAAALAANELGIPVLQIEDFPAMRSKRFQGITAVMNQYARELLTSKGGFGEEDVVITGHPVFEDDLNVDPERLREVREQIGRDEYKNMVLYLEQPIPEAADVEAELRKIARRHPNDLLVFKLHPNQSDPSGTPDQRNVIVTRDIDLKSLLHLCDTAISKTSTAGIEAALLGKPLICVALANRDGAKRIEGFGIAAYTERTEELEELICQCLREDSELARRLAAGREKFNNRKDSLRNIKQCIDDMIGPQ